MCAREVPVNQSYFDRYHQLRMHYFRACLQNILIFLVIFKAQFSIFWPFSKNLGNN